MAVSSRQMLNVPLSTNGIASGGMLRLAWSIDTTPSVIVRPNVPMSTPSVQGAVEEALAMYTSSCADPVMPWAVEALDQYLKEVRPRYPAAAHPALWLTERGGRISPRQVDDRFALWRAAAGLPGELSVHCLRHSYVSHLIEDGVDPLFVQ